VVLVTVLLLTGPLAYLPKAALAAIVFLIAAELIKVKELRDIYDLRKNEFLIAVLTTVAVVVLGVEYGIVLAIAASVIEHLRHSYNPLNTVLLKSPAGHWQPVPVTPGARTEDGIVVYRFGTSLYYANSARLLADLQALATQGDPLEWLVFDCAAIVDIDYTASEILTRVVELAQQHHVRFVLSSVLPPVRRELEAYGISKKLDPDYCYETPGEALDAFRATRANRG